MNKLKFLLRSEIKDIDVIQNIYENTKALLIDDNNFWIEISDNGFYVPDGHTGLLTKDINEAINKLSKVIFENS